MRKGLVNLAKRYDYANSQVQLVLTKNEMEMLTKALIYYIGEEDDLPSLPPEWTQLEMDIIVDLGARVN